MTEGADLTHTLLLEYISMTDVVEAHGTVLKLNKDMVKHSHSKRGNCSETFQPSFVTGEDPRGKNVSLQ